MHDRIVDPIDDAAIVQQKMVGDTGQPRLRVNVINALWFIRHIATGHHQWPIERVEDQVMKRGIRQHEPELFEAWRDGLRQTQGTRRIEKNDRCCGARQTLRLQLAHGGEASDHLDIARHDCEGLAEATLAPA